MSLVERAQEILNAWPRPGLNRSTAELLVDFAKLLEGPGSEPVEESASTIAPEVGKFYRTRDGRMVVVLEEDEDGDKYPYSGYMAGENSPRTWLRDGKYYLDDEEAPLDIVAEATVDEFMQACRTAGEAAS